eukprot:gene14113-14232_t
MMLVSAAQIDRLLDYPALVAALRQAFAGEYVVPTRHHHELSHAATHLIMPAWTAGAPRSGAYLGTKLVNVFRDNAALGLPAIAGTYVLQSGETGVPLCIMDGARLTAHRTAAVSALAASYLARADASHLVMIGAGALAPCLIRAHAAVRPIRTVTLWNRNPASSLKLAEIVRDDGFDVRIAGDVEAAVLQADIVSVATLSQSALVLGEWLRPGVHLDLVGAFNLSMREADDAALLKAQVFIDTPAAKTEGGDVAVAIRAGAYKGDQIAADLFALARGRHQGRTSAAQITLFKSVGTAISDLAAAILVWERVQNS